MRRSIGNQDPIGFKTPVSPSAPIKQGLSEHEAVSRAPTLGYSVHIGVEAVVALFYNGVIFIIRRHVRRRAGASLALRTSFCYHAPYCCASYIFHRPS